MSYTTTTPAAAQGIIDSHREAREAAGSAPTPTQVKRESRNMVIGLAATGIALAVLVSLVLIRVFELALPLSFGPGFAALLAVFVGICFVLITVLLLYGYSRGNLLGEDLAASSAAVEAIEADHERFTAAAEEQVAFALDQTERAKLLLDQVDDIRVARLATAFEGVAAAGTVLGITEMPTVAKESLNAIPTKVRENAEARIASADTTASEILAEAQKRTINATTRPLDAHANFHAKHLGTIDHSSADETPVPIAKSPSRGWILPVAVAAAVLLIAGAILALALGPLAAVAAAPEPGTAAEAVPTASAGGPRQGVDYAFQAVGADGTPVHWACGTGIRVAFDGTQPVGADAVLAEAVAIVAGASGLPLEIGAGPGDITVGYASDAAFDDVAGAADAIGVANTQWNTATGLIGSSIITIDASASSNAVDNPRAAWVIAHELAHAVGLDHAEDPTELMAPRLAANLTELGDGDRFALATVGC
jgi:hypothetical protein